MRYVYISYITLCVVCAIALVRVWYAYTHPYVPKVATHITVECNGQILRYPDIRENFQHLYVQTLESSLCKGEQVLVRAQNYHNIIPGDFVSVRGKLLPIENFSTASDREFNLKGFRAKDGVYITMDNPFLEHTGSFKCAITLPSSWYVCSIRNLYILKVTISELLQSVLPYPESALALGIVLGEKQGLGKELLEVFRVAGLSHIVVLSGFNVTILAVVFGALLYGRIYRGMRALTIVSILSVFALFVGLGSTVVRTVCMATLLAGAEFYYRRPKTWRVLLFAASGMIIYEPLLALYDPSFHLSFLALIGVVYGTPYIQKVLDCVCKFMHLYDWLYDSDTVSAKICTALVNIVVATLGAFGATAPYIWWSMGEVSWWGILTNIGVVPLIPCIMALTVLTAIITTLSHLGGIVIAVPLTLILSWILAVARLPELGRYLFNLN